MKSFKSPRKVCPAERNELCPLDEDMALTREIILVNFDLADDVATLMTFVRDNDGKGADEFLMMLSSSRRDRLLREPIIIQDQSEAPNQDNFYRKMDYTWISMIAAGAGADQVFYQLIKYGAEWDVCEKDGSTLGHAIVYGSYFALFWDNAFVSIYKQFLSVVSSPDALKRIMFMEESTGARPLELAAKLGRFVIFHHIMETESLYKTVLTRHGTWNRVVYDFSEYEKSAPEGRRAKSPLRIFTFLQEEDLDSPGFKELFLSSAMKAWIGQHVTMTRFMLFVWFMTRTFFTVVYLSNMAAVNDFGSNTTCPPAWEILVSTSDLDHFLTPDMVLLWICTLCFFVFDTCDCVHYVLIRRKFAGFYQRPGYNGSYLVHSGGHRVLQLLFVLLVLAWLVCRQQHMSGMISVYVGSALVVSWTYLYFLQFVPRVGHLVIGLNRSLITYASFSAIFGLIFCSFGMAFYILDKVSCLDFSVAGAFYQTFMIFLNQVDLTKLTSLYPLEWSIFHVIFIMLTVILLLNFCIAILSESAIRITSHKETLQDMQYLNASILIEDRIGWIVRPIKDKFRKVPRDIGTVKVSVKLAQHDYVDLNQKNLLFERMNVTGTKV